MSMAGSSRTGGSTLPASRKLKTTARGLMLGGYLPFLVLTLSLPFGTGLFEQTVLLTLLLGYGAVILSFLGGIRWGLAVASGQDVDAGLLVLSVVPSLIGWLALTLDAIPALVLLAATFAWHYGWDRRAVLAGRMPSWFGQLRRAISALVVPTLLIAAAFVLVF